MPRLKGGIGVKRAPRVLGESWSWRASASLDFVGLGRPGAAG